MALVLGTNYGFVTTAPVGNPNAGNASTIDGWSHAIKHTSPAVYTKVTQIGWYCGASAGNSNFEVGLYSHNAANDEPETLLAVSRTNAQGGTTGWITVTVDWDITPETTYWIAVQVDSIAGSISTQWGSLTGGRTSTISSSSTLPDTWPSVSEGAYGQPFYALVSEGAEYVDIESTIDLTIGISGTLDVVTYVDLESTIDFTIGISGTLAVTSTIDLEATIPLTIGVSGTLTVSTDWKTANFKTNKTLVVFGNDCLYYES